jgi:hypothetical protein
MSLYDRVNAMPRGGRALAAARLRRTVILALHKALRASGLESQSQLAKRLHVRRSAVNQVLRGDGNVRIDTLAEYLYEMGFEVSLAIVAAGELHSAELDNRSPLPAFVLGSSTSGSTAYTTSNWHGLWTAMPSSPTFLASTPIAIYAGCSFAPAIRVISGNSNWTNSYSPPSTGFEPVKLSYDPIGAAR